MRPDDIETLRRVIADFPSDVSTDAHGVQAPTREEMYAPEGHAAALDMAAPIVVGSRGVGKSFWAGVLADDILRSAAAEAYPQLDLQRLIVRFGFTGLPGPEGVDKAKIDAVLPPNCTAEDARTFWWATILRAVGAIEKPPPKLASLIARAGDVEERDASLQRAERQLDKSGQTLLIVFDALDTVASDWDRRRILTQALLEVIWALRAWRRLRPKLFVRPDQLDDDALRFVELPKQRTGAIRLRWTGTDLYGLLFARLATGKQPDAFHRLLKEIGIKTASEKEILTRRWILSSNEDRQRSALALLAGEFMGTGLHGHKKGRTYDWILTHLADALGEVTPRSFLGLAIGAAKHPSRVERRVLAPEGIHHGLKLASRTRVDQLHHEFPWIKGVLAPLAGLLLPKDESSFFMAWKKAKTVDQTLDDAQKYHYLLPAPELQIRREAGLLASMIRVGVVYRRQDDRLDMPDLFRIAARLLKKGATAPL